jgi:hypothetical protein
VAREQREGDPTGLTCELHEPRASASTPSLGDSPRRLIKRTLRS